VQLLQSRHSFRQHEHLALDVWNTGPNRLSLRLIKWPVWCGYRVARDHPYTLTAKEHIVLGMMADGQTNAVIADEMSRSRRTIENHVSAIVPKLNCRNRIEVVLRSQRKPWILRQK
jgi:DNA-binding NarL/FixJ family response regulator